MQLQKFAVIGLLLASAGSLTAGEALSSITLSGFPTYIPNGGGGFAFVSSNAMTITGLGFHLDSSSGITDEIVEVLDGSSNVLASARINTSSRQIGQFWYQQIAGVPVTPGAPLYVVGYDAGVYAATTNKFWLGTTIFKDTPSTAWFSVAPELTYLGPAQGVTISGGTNVLYYGVNFLFGPPRPPLYIEMTSATTVQLSWPTQAVGFSLQSTLNPVSWPPTNLPVTPAVVGTNYTVSLPDSGPGTFFRLRY